MRFPTVFRRSLILRVLATAPSTTPATFFVPSRRVAASGAAIAAAAVMTTSTAAATSAAKTAATGPAAANAAASAAAGFPRISKVEGFPCLLLRCRRRPQELLTIDGDHNSERSAYLFTAREFTKWSLVKGGLAIYVLLVYC